MNDPERVIRDIQKDYFAVLNACIPEEWKKLERTGRPILELLASHVPERRREIWVPSATGSASATEYYFDTVTKEISLFWHDRFPELHEALKALKTLKLFVSGHAHEQFLTLEDIGGLGLYFDTICVCDPIPIGPGRWTGDLRHIPANYKRGIGFCSILSQFRLAGAALADCWPPICVIYPRVLAMQQNGIDHGDEDAATQAAIRFYKEFFALDNNVETLEALIQEAAGVDDKLVEQRAKENTLFSDMTHDFEFLHESVETLLPGFGATPSPQLARSKAQRVLLGSWPATYTRLVHRVQCDFECAALELDCFYESPNAWRLHAWNTQIETEGMARKLGFSEQDAFLRYFHVDGIKWLGGVGLHALTRLRTEGYMEEIRALFRASSTEIRHASINDFSVTMESIAKQVGSEIQAHSDQIKDLKRDLAKRLGLDVAGLAFSGGLAILSASLPLLSAMSLLFGGRSLFDLIADVRSVKGELDGLRHRPVAVLADAWAKQRQSR